MSKSSDIEDAAAVALEIVEDLASSKVTGHSLVMTAAEAQTCIEAIRQHAVSLRQLLVELHDRRGWEALGYSSITACLVAEFHNSKPVLVRELKVGRIEKHHLQVPIGTYRESQLRPLSKLSSAEYYGSAIALAHHLAGEQQLTANHVNLAVNQLKLTQISKIQPVTPLVLPYKVGDIVVVNCVRAIKEDYAKYDRYWAIVKQLHSHGCIVQLMGQDWNIHHNDLKEMDWVDESLKLVAPRIVALLERDDLDEMEREILERYHRKQWLTPWQLQLLETIEDLRFRLTAQS